MTTIFILKNCIACFLIAYGVHEILMHFLSRALVLKAFQNKVRLKIKEDYNYILWIRVDTLLSKLGCIKLLVLKN